MHYSDDGLTGEDKVKLSFSGLRGITTVTCVFGAILAIERPQRPRRFFSGFVGVGRPYEFPPLGDGIGSQQFHAY